MYEGAGRPPEENHKCLDSKEKYRRNNRIALEVCHCRRRGTGWESLVSLRDVGDLDCGKAPLAGVREQAAESELREGDESQTRAEREGHVAPAASVTERAS